MITYVNRNAPRVLAHVTQMTFPGGEVGVRLTQPISGAVNVWAHIHNSDDVMALLLTVDAMRRENPSVELHLALPHVPYARQDRVCNEGEALSAAVFVGLINSLNFKSVGICDPHSDVVPALLQRATITNQVEVFSGIYTSWQDMWIVAPDAGATKKAETFAKAVGAAGVIHCSKKRDLKTGALTGFVCHDDVKDKRLLVLDDICDGGGTFLGLANILKGHIQLDLAVTHGIFSKGIDALSEAFDTIYTTNSYWGVVPEELQRPNVVWGRGYA